MPRTDVLRARLPLLVLFSCMLLTGIACGGGSGGGGGGGIGGGANQPVTPANGNGSHILFTRPTGFGGNDLCIVPVNGGTVRRITAHNGEGIAGLQRTGATVVWLQFNAAQEPINFFAADLPGGNPRTLTNFPDGMIQPEFLIAGSRVVFRREVAGVRNFWSVPVAGGTALNLTNYTTGQIQDGELYLLSNNHIVYSYDPTGTGANEVYSVDPAGAAPRRISRTGIDTSLAREVIGDRVFISESNAGMFNADVSVNAAQATLNHVVHLAAEAGFEQRSQQSVGTRQVYTQRNTATDSDRLAVSPNDGSLATMTGAAFAGGERIRLIANQYLQNDLLFVAWRDDDQATAGTNEALSELYWANISTLAPVKLTSIPADDSFTLGEFEIDVVGRQGSNVYYTRGTSPGKVFVATAGSAMSDRRIDSSATLPPDVSFEFIFGEYAILSATSDDGFGNTFRDFYSYRAHATAPEADKLTDTFLDETAAPSRVLKFSVGGQLITQRGGDFFRIVPGVEVGAVNLNGDEVADNNAAQNAILQRVAGNRVFYTTSSSTNLFMFTGTGTKRTQISIFDATQSLDNAAFGGGVLALSNTHVVFGIRRATSLSIGSSGLDYTAPNPVEVTNPGTGEDRFLLLW